MERLENRLGEQPCGFMFHASYMAALLRLPTAEQQQRFLLAVVEYGAFGRYPSLGDDPVLEAMFELAMPNLDISRTASKRKARKGKTPGEE